MDNITPELYQKHPKRHTHVYLSTSVACFDHSTCVLLILQIIMWVPEIAGTEITPIGRQRIKKYSLRGTYKYLCVINKITYFCKNNVTSFSGVGLFKPHMGRVPIIYIIGIINSRHMTMS